MKKLFGGLLLFLVLFPIWLMFTGSMMGADELFERFGGVLFDGRGEVRLDLWPSYPTFSGYVDLLLDSPGFFVMFWNSVLHTGGVLLGQAISAVPAAWAFSRYRFYGRKLLFLLYSVLMLLPFQVMMVSNYLVLHRLALIDTHLAIILPGMFAAFPVFIMTKYFKGIPQALIEAARVDGASEWTLFFKIGIPMGYPGILSAGVLGFLECWNSLEQPLLFLKDKTKWPLALYLPNSVTDKAAVSFAASVVMMMPALLLFINGQEYLEQGIAASGIKE